ncbi:MAG: response regulator [Rufibacter sp.]
MQTYLIDDDPISLFLTEQLIKLEGIPTEIKSYASGEKALHSLIQTIPQEVPAVIFLDLEMPVLSGWEFLDALVPSFQQLEGRCQVFILTSSLFEADAERCKNYLLVAGFLHKPIKKEDIKMVFSQILQKPEELILI